MTEVQRIESKEIHFAVSLSSTLVDLSFSRTSSLFRPRSKAQSHEGQEKREHEVEAGGYGYESARMKDGKG